MIKSHKNCILIKAVSQLSRTSSHTRETLILENGCTET